MDNPQETNYFLEKANHIARNKEWKILAEQTLALLREICLAEAAILCHPGQDEAEPAEKQTEERPVPWIGAPKGLSPQWWSALRKKLAQPELFSGSTPRLIDRDTVSVEPVIAQAFEHLDSLQNMLILPIKPLRGSNGGILLLNCAAIRLELAGLITNRMATEMEKAADLEAARKRETRLMVLNDILGQLGTSLNPDQVLRMFIERARQFLNVEAVSLFLIEENSGDMVLQMASQLDKGVQVEKVRVPKGVGIIGRVVQTGETLLVENAKQDRRHYGGIDQMSGFQTQSILAVPLRARTIDLGGGRGTSQERVIGGLEAINKIDGAFRADDIELLQILAQGASTILVVAQLYVDTNNMFVDVIGTLAADIDTKGPYTTGHSQRVSEYAVEIATELGLSEEDIYQIRLGSLFYNIEKIGDTGSIDAQGSQPNLWKTHLARTPGSGETDELIEERSQIIRKIATVADVFDAMTCDRSYQPGMPAEEVFDYLQENAGTKFDPACVEALISAYRLGKINPPNSP